MELYFDQPAQEWEETLPIGNGFLGAMIRGGINSEVIGLNDEQLWSGYSREKRNKTAHHSLEKVRQLILDKETKQAEEIIAKEMLGEYNESYLPVGQLVIETENNYLAFDYKRSLAIDQSLVTIDMEGETKQSREYFASFPEKAIYGKWTQEDKNLSIKVGFNACLQADCKASREDLVLTIKAPEHMEPNYIGGPIIQGTKGGEFSYVFELLQTDGQVITHQETLEIHEASEIIFAFHRKEDQVSANYQAAKKEHLTDYHKLYNRVILELGKPVDLPITKRVERLRQGKKDPDLLALYFQYNRYLLISSSRKGSLPANLQGIWSWQKRAPWSSNWTTNINAEMNYWGADVANLSECFTPYSEFVEKIVENGKQTAQDYYGVNGTCCHHNVDKWMSTNPVGYPKGSKEASKGAVSWAMWPMAAVWMTADLYRHYEYMADKNYLKDTVYPNLREATLFLTEYLVEVDGTYRSIPSSSPENKFYDQKGNVVSVDQSVTMDLCLIKENFHFFEQTCQELGIMDPLLEKVQYISNHLPTIKIGSQGHILEWQEEYKEVEPGHRHVSHLYGLYPGDIYDETYQQAARKSLALRIQNGGGHTGWSNAWLVNLFARLGDGKQAYHHIISGITNASYDNLWSKHPPFQIDGNFGVLAGIANLFVQDRNEGLQLLPALPKELKDGHVKGLRIKGKQCVELFWKDGEIVTSKITEAE